MLNFDVYNVKIIIILLSVKSIQSKIKLTAYECKEIIKSPQGRKNADFKCPLMTFDNRPLKERCLEAGCCYFPHNADENKRCFLDNNTIDAQTNLLFSLQNDRIKDPSLNDKYLNEVMEEQEVLNNLSNKHNIARFPGRLDVNSNKYKRLEDGQRCQNNILEILNSGKIDSATSCIESIPYENRQKCDTTTITDQDDTLSLCSACIKVNCCYDPNPKVINGALIPMCFTNEKPKVQAKNVAPNSLTNLAARSRYSTFIKENYGINSNERTQPKVETPSSDNSPYNSRLSGFFNYIGNKNSFNSVPSMNSIITTNGRQPSMLNGNFGKIKHNVDTGNSKVNALLNMGSKPLFGGLDFNNLDALLNGHNTNTEPETPDQNKTVPVEITTNQEKEMQSDKTNGNLIDLSNYVEDNESFIRNKQNGGLNFSFDDYDTLNMMVDDGGERNIKNYEDDEHSSIKKPSITIEKIIDTEDDIPDIKYGIASEDKYTCYPQKCGIAVRDTQVELNEQLNANFKKIAGGTQAGNVQFWPWQLMLLREYTDDKFMSQLCGATLISHSWMLTAAHCFIAYEKKFHMTNHMDKNIKNFVVHAGRYHVDDINRNVERIAIKTLKEYKYHEEFDPKDGKQHFDIALGKFNVPIEFTNYIQPICLPSIKHVLPKYGDEVYITGWGDSKNINPSKNLKEIKLPIASESTCKNEWEKEHSDFWLCTESSKNEDACVGDSGGPAVHKTAEDGPWRIVGVIAAGDANCNTGDVLKPGVFTDVAKFRHWIDGITGGACE